MAKQSKRFREAQALVDEARAYAPDEAIALIKQAATAKFDESVDVALKLGVDPRQADQQVRGTVVLPHGTGKNVRVAVFAQGDAAREAEEAGADLVGAEDLAKRIEGGEFDFDVAVATPDMMAVVGRLGRILGPRGLMPNPKAGTVTTDVARAISEIKAGKVEYRVNREAGVHVSIGKASFSQEALVDNFRVLMGAIMGAKPSAAKGAYLRKAALSSTMGPGLQLDVQQAAAGAGAE